MQEDVDPRAFVATLAPAVRQAAAIARALEGRVENRPKADEDTDVKAALTIADTAVQEAILASLSEHFPQVSVRAEEDTPAVAQFPVEERDRPRVVIDPIDGTLRSYLEQRGPYGVLVGLWRGGGYEAALVALPREGLYFEAALGGPALRARPGGPSRPAQAEARGRTVLVSHGAPEAVVEAVRARGFEVARGCGGAVAVAPLIPGVRAGLRVASPGGQISIRGRIGLVIARAGGAEACDRAGRDFPRDPEAFADALVVSADPADRDTLLEILDAA